MDISKQCKNKGKTMKNTSKEATHPVIPWDTSKSFMHYDKENSSSLKVCQVGPSHLTVIFICCQQRFVLLVAAFFMRKRSSLCMHFFDSKYCFRQELLFPGYTLIRKWKTAHVVIRTGFWCFHLLVSQQYQEISLFKGRYRRKKQGKMFSPRGE